MRYYEYSSTGTRYSLCVKEKSFRTLLDSIKMRQEDKPCFVNSGKDATTHFIETTKGMHVVICLSDISKYTENEQLGLILHECIHVWQEIIEWMGEDKPGAEIEAYSIQSIFVNMLHEYRRKTKGKG